MRQCASAVRPYGNFTVPSLCRGAALLLPSFRLAKSALLRQVAPLFWYPLFLHSILPPFFSLFTLSPSNLLTYLSVVILSSIAIHDAGRTGQLTRSIVPTAKMASTAMDYEPTNGERFEGAF